MTEQAQPAPPEDLGERGRALWREVVALWSLRPDELRVLAHACREEELIARMSAEQATAELIAEGYNGQPVAAPLVSELRQHRATFAALMRQLKLPDENDGARRTASQAGRELVNARWRPRTTG